MSNKDFLDFIQSSELSRERAEEIYNGLIVENHYLQRLGPEETASLVFLMDKQLKQPGTVQVLSSPEVITPMMVNELDAVVVSFTILGHDWAGLLEGCASVLHSSKLNIRYTRGFVVKYGEYKFGLTFFEITPETVEELNYLMTRRDEIVFKLSKIAVKSDVLNKFQEGSAIKVALFLGIADYIREHYKRENLEAILGSSGEAVKFFEARSELYIRERSQADIARMIVNNYNFSKAVGQDRERVMVDIRNLVVGTNEKEILTGITIAADLDRMSLPDCFNIIDHVEPGFIRKHDKGFFRSDNIGVFRIEICSRDGKPLDDEKISLLKKMFQQRGGKYSLPKLSPGVELVQRTIVPEMCKEEHRLGIPQVYVHPHSDSFLKIIIVSSGRFNGYSIPMAASLNQHQGFTCVAAETPSKLHYDGEEYDERQEVVILDLWIDEYEFFSGARDFNVEDILDRVGTILKTVDDIGPHLRIFDLTSRALRKRRLNDVLNIIDPDYDPAVVKEIFARLGDKYILNPVIPDKELAAVISLGTDMLTMREEAADGWVCRLEEIGFGGVPPYPWLAVACPENKKLPVFISGLKDEYNIKTFTIIKQPPNMLLLVKFSRGGFIGEPGKKEAFMNQVTKYLSELEITQGWGSLREEG